MPWPKGKPRLAKTNIEPKLALTPKPAYRSVTDLVAMMEEYRTQSNGRNRGLFEDCKADIYRLFAVDYRDKQVAEIRATGTTDRVYGEWEQKFARAFRRAAA